jgi:hypothetical protein
MSYFVYDHPGNFFWERCLGENEPGIEFASTDGVVEACGGAGNRCYPHAFEIANETIIPDPIIDLD